MDRSLPPAPCAEAPAFRPEPEEPGPEAPSLAPGGASEGMLRRLRWRARRGLLENDLLIGRFLDRQGGTLGSGQIDALARLLELPEAELLGLLLGRQPPAGELDTAPVRDVLDRLRSEPAR
jgi:antitoxin CptB